MKSFRKQLDHDDRGVALVLAMGVALIGISVAAIVVTQVIVASNDSGRDRVRTTEVHSAEGAVDATMAELETAAPCPGPSFSPLTYGNGSQATQVTVVIDYSNDSGPLTCSDASGSTGTLSGVPNKAVVTATSVGVVGGLGIQPERNMQSELKLTPNVSNGVNAAIFAGRQLTYNANLQVVPSSVGETADVWLDTGDWNCSGASGSKGGIVIQGSLYVPDGTLWVGKDCNIGGDVWVQHGLKLNSGTVIGGSVTVRSAPLTHAGFTVGGDVLVGGANDGVGTINAPGTVTFNVGVAAIPNHTSVGLPQIEYVEADWTMEGFTPKALSSFNGGNCVVNSTVTLGGSKASPQKQVYDLRGYDLRGCDPLDLKNGADFQICEDTALFVSGIKSASSYTVGSCDGKKHKFWVIVPYSTYNGNMDSNKGSVEFDSNIESFWYAPEGLYLQTHSTFYGQIYGGDLNIKNDSNYNYVNVGVPGVDLTNGTAAASSGFRVELVSKREVS